MTGARSWVSPFCSDGEFHSHSEFSNKQGVQEEMFAITLEDSVDLAIVQRVLKVLILRVMAQVVIETSIIDGIYIYVSVGVEKGFPKEGIMLLGVSGVGRVEVLRLIAGLRDGQSLLNPVDGGIRDMKPGKAEDDVFLSTVHDIEEMFLSNPFDVDIEGASIVDCTGFICSLVDIANSNEGGEFLGEESVFSDKLPVYTRDVHSGIYQCGGVNNFEGV